jgi:hypothetical protein
MRRNYAEVRKRRMMAIYQRAHPFSVDEETDDDTDEDA